MGRNGAPRRPATWGPVADRLLWPLHMEKLTNFHVCQPSEISQSVAFAAFGPVHFRRHFANAEPH